MNTIQKLNVKIHDLARNHIPPRLRQRFVWGLVGLGLSEFRSLNANGRGLTAHPKTGERRMERLVRDGRLSALIQTIIATYFLAVPGQLHCSLDHSQFGRFYIAILAVSLGKGRQLPIWCQVGRKDRVLMRPLIAALRRLFKSISHDDRHRLIITMDRWFASPKLLPFLDRSGVRFICRVKYNLPIMVPWDCFQTVAAGEVSHEQTACQYAGLELRLVRSQWRADMKEDEPWFLLTNDRAFTRQQIINRYAKRFEIEETFKDVKWIQQYEWQRVLTPAVIAAVLSFVFLSWWLIYEACQPIIRLNRSRRIHPKHKLSWFRDCWEHLQRAMRAPTLDLLFTG